MPPYGTRMVKNDNFAKFRRDGPITRLQDAQNAIAK